MSPHQPLVRRRVFLALAREKISETNLAARPKDIMFGNEVVDCALHSLRRGIVSRAHICELGLASSQRTRRRHGNGVQHSQYDRHGHKGSVGVPQAIAKAVETPPIITAAQSAFLV
jgi:hypothetical protein